MSTPDREDPVNRWATEHYGFEEDDRSTNATAQADHAPALPVRPGKPHAAARPPRRTSRIASGVLGLVVIVGAGGAAAAAAGGSGGDDGRDRGNGGVVQLDGQVDGRGDGPR